MAKLKSISPKKLVKILNYLGFKETRITGSHHRFIHRDGRKTTVPFHGSVPIGPGLLLKIIKSDLKIKRKDFEKLLEKY